MDGIIKPEEAAVSLDRPVASNLSGASPAFLGQLLRRKTVKTVFRILINPDNELEFPAYGCGDAVGRRVLSDAGPAVFENKQLTAA